MLNLGIITPNGYFTCENRYKSRCYFSNLAKFGILKQAKTIKK